MLATYDFIFILQSWREISVLCEHFSIATIWTENVLHELLGEHLIFAIFSHVKLYIFFLNFFLLL